jgi:hypothetical protein
MFTIWASPRGHKLSPSLGMKYRNPIDDEARISDASCLLAFQYMGDAAMRLLVFTASTADGCVNNLAVFLAVFAKLVGTT